MDNKTIDKVRCSTVFGQFFKVRSSLGLPTIQPILLSAIIQVCLHSSETKPCPGLSGHSEPSEEPVAEHHQ